MMARPPPPGVLFLVVGSGIVTIARAMTLSFLAIKLQGTFGLGPAMIGFLLGLGPLLGALAAPFAGSISDRVGRQALLKLTLMGLSVSMIAMGFAQTVFAFCFAQTVAAISTALYGPISRALLSDICSKPVRLKYFSWRYTASNAGWVVGPMIGIAAGIGASNLFIAAGCVYTLLALVLQFLKLPRVERRDNHLQSPSAPLLNGIKVAFTDRRLIFFVSGGTLLIAVYGQWSATMASYLSLNIAGGAEIFAALVSINGLVVLMGNTISRRVVERVGALVGLVTGCVLLVLSHMGFMVSATFAGFAVSMVVFTLGEILIVPSDYMLVDGIANDENRGSYFGAHAISTVGGFLGPTLGGVTLAVAGGVAMFTLFACFAATSAIFFAKGTRIPPTQPQDTFPQSLE